MPYFKPHDYQATGQAHLIKYDRAGLFMDMGLGKTVVTLTDIMRCLNTGKSKKVLIVAPKRVARHTWTDEAAKWDQLKGLRIQVISGDEKKRKKQLREPVQVFTIGVDLFPWLVALYSTDWPFDYLVIDELSMFKSHKSKRFKAATIIQPYVKKFVGLTGTPMPNGLLDLWSQVYLIDFGKRLGKTIGDYRYEFFDRGRQLADHTYDYVLKRGNPSLGSDIYEKCVYDRIRDICISMRACDHLDLPPRIDETRNVYLEPEDLEGYKEFERDAVLSIFGEDEEVIITAANAAALSGKLLQYANGAIYSTEDRREYRTVHNHKLEALGEYLEAANGRPALIMYSFRHDVERIKGYLGKDFKIYDFDTPDVITRWNRRELQVLVGHPKGMGHGLNLQEGGELIGFFGNTWSSELYRQAIARIDRQGKSGIAVLNSRFVSVGTIDERCVDKVDGKIDKENGFMNYIRAVVKEHRPGALITYKNVEQ